MKRCKEKEEKQNTKKREEVKRTEEVDKRKEGKKETKLKYRDKNLYGMPLRKTMDRQRSAKMARTENRSQRDMK